MLVANFKTQILVTQSTWINLYFVHVGLNFIVQHADNTAVSIYLQIYNHSFALKINLKNPASSFKLFSYFCFLGRIECMSCGLLRSMISCGICQSDRLSRRRLFLLIRQMAPPRCGSYYISVTTYYTWYSAVKYKRDCNHVIFEISASYSTFKMRMRCCSTADK